MNKEKAHQEKECWSISKRALGLLSALGMFVLLLSFLTGYFWGKHTALQELVKTIEEKGLSDRISSSIYSFALARNSDIKNSESDSEAVVVETAIIEPDQELNEDNKVAQREDELPVVHMPSEVCEKGKEDTVPTQGYYAQLIGFNSKKSADLFAGRVAIMGLATIVKELTSMHPRSHKKRTWYQVVTTPYIDKNDLERVLDPIIKKEHINGVKIINCAMHSVSKEEKKGTML